MSTLGPASTTSNSDAVSRVAIARLADYVEMAKPRISLMVLVTVTVGYALGSAGSWQIARLINAVLGIVLVATSSSAFNQILERRTDALMARTRTRPLPSGRMSVREVLTFATFCGTFGLLWLLFFVNLTTALLAGATLLLYVLAYTPLKRHTSLCTAVGAIPGALPPVLGWTASGTPLDARAVSLFAILFLWQFPHFLAIGWLYRGEYRGAGLKMLPADGLPRATALLAVGYALLLIPVSLLPSDVGLAGDGYRAAALILSLGYLLCSLRFLRRETVQTARGLLLSSLVYLPVLLLALTWDHFKLLQ